MVFVSWPGDSDENGALRERFYVVRHFPFESEQLPLGEIKRPACRSDENVASDRLNGDRSRRTVLGQVRAGAETNEQNAKVGILHQNLRVPAGLPRVILRAESVKLPLQFEREERASGWFGRPLGAGESVF
jgi:hypothetical protein